MRLILNLCLASAVVCSSSTAHGYDVNMGIPLPEVDASTQPQLTAVDPSDLPSLPSHGRLSKISESLTADLAYKSASTRGAADVKAFERLSPSVLLILAEGGSGTGSLISADGEVLTNWHVVGSDTEVDVIYRPADVSKEVYGERSYAARVVKVDQVADLALLKIIRPKMGVTPLTFASADPQVGEDVSAIGHPNGLSWSYTRGIVTGMRSDYSWQYSDGFQHLAKVVQTQTPINPGNSGGPLFNSAGEIVGVNSFKDQGEVTNFAVSIDSVNEFLNRNQSRFAPRIPGSEAMSQLFGSCDEVRQVGEPALSDDEQSIIRYLDFTCDGLVDAFRSDSVDRSVVYIDTVGDGKVDTTLVDLDKDGAWDLSFYDVNADGESDVVGYHSAENAAPFEFSSYGKFAAMAQ